MLKEIRVERFRKKRPDYSDNIIQEFDCHNLSLWYMRSKKDKDDLLDTFNLELDDEINDTLTTPLGDHEMKTVFLELCFLYRLNPEKVKKYYKFLEKRQKDIIKVIDKHFKLLRTPLLNKKKEQLEKSLQIQKAKGNIVGLK